MKSIQTTSICLFLLFLIQFPLSAEDDHKSNFSEPTCILDPIEMYNPIVTHADCDECNGAVVILHAEEENKQYEYTSDEGSTWQLSNVFEDLCIGDYLFSVREISDPTAFGTTIIQMTDLCNLIYLIELEQPSVIYPDCDDCNGAITVLHVEGLNQDYEYSNDFGITWQLSNVFEGLCHGQYQFLVRNISNPMESGAVNVQLTDPCFNVGQLNIYGANVVHATCDECNGTIEILHTSEENHVYEYSIDNGLTYQLSPYFEGLCYGDYLLIARDKNNPNISSFSTTQIAFGQELEMINFSFDCNVNQNSASVATAIVGGIAEYDISYIDPSGVAYEGGFGLGTIVFDMPNLLEGEYQFFAEDRVGCMKDTIINIRSEYCTTSPIEIFDSVVTQAYCDECNGSVEISHLLEVNQEYEYSINGGLTWQLSNLFEDLCIGEYFIITRDKFDQTNSAISTVQVTAGLDLEIVNFTFDCNIGQYSAMASMQVVGGMTAYQLSYINPNGLTYEGGAGSDIIEFTMPYLVVGAYQFFVEDQSGCQKDTIILVEENCSYPNPGPGNQLPNFDLIDMGFTEWGGTISQFSEGEINVEISQQQIFYSSNESLEIIVYNTSGQNFYQGVVPDQANWNTNVQLPMGIYYIVLQSDSGKEKVFKRFIY